MRTILPLLLFFAFSCESEYAERFKLAVKLKKEYLKIKAIADESHNNLLQRKLSELQKEIVIQAQISGNEELFLKEIWRD